MQYVCKDCSRPGNADDFPAAHKADYRCRSCIRKAHKRWRDRNPEKVKAWCKRTSQWHSTTIRGHLSCLLGLCKRRHRGTARNAACGLTLDYLCALYEQQRGVCPLSGYKMSLRKGAGKGVAWPYTPSLDRIDRNRGYVIGNVRLVCHWANVMRSRFSDDELLAMCKAIVAHLEGR